MCGVLDVNLHFTWIELCGHNGFNYFLCLICSEVVRVIQINRIDTPVMRFWPKTGLHFTKQLQSLKAEHHRWMGFPLTLLWLHAKIPKHTHISPMHRKDHCNFQSSCEHK